MCYFSLFLLFFGPFFAIFDFFSLAPLEEENSAIFWYFLLIFCLFFHCTPLPGKFFAGALVGIVEIMNIVKE